jgi:predicted lipid-binding transport protein (Tim44 family)
LTFALLMAAVMSMLLLLLCERRLARITMLASSCFRRQQPNQQLQMSERQLHSRSTAGAGPAPLVQAAALWMAVFST